MLTDRVTTPPSTLWVKKLVPEVKWQTVTEFEQHVQRNFFVHLEPLINCFDNLGKVCLQLQTKPYLGAGLLPSGTGYFVNLCSTPVMDRQGNYYWYRVKPTDLLIEFSWQLMQKSTVVTKLQLPQVIREEYMWVVLTLLETITSALGLSRLRVELKEPMPKQSGYEMYPRLPLPVKVDLVNVQCGMLYGHPTVFYKGQPFFVLKAEKGRNNCEGMGEFKLKKALQLPSGTHLNLEYVGWQFTLEDSLLKNYQELALKVLLHHYR